MQASTTLKGALAAILISGTAHAGGYGMPYGQPGYGMPGPYGPPGYGMPGYGIPQAHGNPAYGQPQGKGGYSGQHAYGSQPRATGGYGSAAGGSDSGGSNDGAGRSDVVTVSGMQFQPAILEIASGEVVTWKFADPMPHTVMGRNGQFSSARQTSGGTFQHTFTEPGEYAYYCSVHPNMQGKVIVR